MISVEGNENFRTFVSMKHPKNEKSTVEFDSYSFFLFFSSNSGHQFSVCSIKYNKKRVEDVFNDMTDRQCLATAVSASTK